MALQATIKSSLVKPVIRVATKADLDRFYGKGKFTATTRAIVGLVRGRIVGCGGIAFVAGKVWAFCDLKPSAYRYKVSLVKAAAGVIAEARAQGIRIMWAEMDTTEPGAERWLRSMGFMPTSTPRIYRWMA